MIKKPEAGSCEVVVSLTRYTELMILRAVKCGEDGGRVFHRHLPESGLLMCPTHNHFRFGLDRS